MSPKLLGVGLVGLMAGAGAMYFTRTAPPAETPRAFASETQAPAAAPTPAPNVEPERAVPAPASSPVAATTVPVATPERKPVPRRAVAPEPRVLTPDVSATPARANASEPPAVVDPPQPAAPTPAPATAPPEIQKPRFDEVTVAADAVLGVTMDSTISSETAKVEDRVNARVSRDVLVDGKVAVPAGARLEGVVTEVNRGGKFKERPRIGVTFQTLTLADGTKIALATDTVFRDGEAPANVNAKVGGSGVVGAILGAMIGGKKGAVLGGAAGAAGGAAVVAAGNRAEVVLLSGSSLTVRLKQPIKVLVER